MITTRLRVITVALALVSGSMLASATTPKTYVRWPGQACVWDPVVRSQGQIAVTSISLYNNSYDARLQLFCPLPFLESYDDAGQLRGFSAATVWDSPIVYLYDGSDDATDGKIRSQIYQFDAGANGNWSSCSNVYTDALASGYATLSPPYCSSVYQIATLMVELPKVSAEWYSASAMRFYKLDNVY